MTCVCTCVRGSRLAIYFNFFFVVAGGTPERCTGAARAAAQGAVRIRKINADLLLGNWREA